MRFSRTSRKRRLRKRKNARAGACFVVTHHWVIPTPALFPQTVADFEISSLKFPPSVYESINEYYVEKVEVVLDLLDHVTYVGRAGRIGIDHLFQIFGFNSMTDGKSKDVDGLFCVMS